MSTRIATDRVFTAHRQPGQPGTATTDAAWGRRAQEFFDRNNSVSIQGRELDGQTFRRIVSAPAADRGRIAAEALGQPRLDWADTRRFVDDVIAANPSASGQRFAISETQARTHGLVDEHRRYGGRRLELESTPRPPPPPPPGAHESQVRARLGTEAGPVLDAYRSHSEVRTLIDGDAFQRLRAQDQTTLLQGLDASRAPGYSRLLESRNFGALSRADQGRLLEVAGQTPTSDLSHLRTVLDRRLDSTSGLRGHSLVGRETLLDGLHRAATAPLHAAVERARVDRSELVGSLTREVALPRDVDQGPMGMCGTTAAQYGLVRRYPAEYARIVSQLATDGSTTLADREPLQLTRENLRRGLVGDHDRLDTRSPSERIFQGSLAQGVFADPDGGIDAAQNAYELSRLFGRDYTVRAVEPRTAGSPGDSSVSVEGATATELVDHLRTNPTSLNLVGMRFGGADSAHELTFDHAEGGRIYLRNPWGAAPDSAYDSRPYVRVEDAQRGVISISEADFRDRVLHVIHED